MRGADGVTLNPVLGIGTFCTHTLVHALQAVPIPADLPPAQMSLIGCGVMAGLGAALYTGGITRGDSVAVFGCGGVGDAAIAGSRLAGASRVIAVDIDARKLDQARNNRMSFRWTCPYPMRTENEKLFSDRLQFG
jgi:S-(hydroxymethyl)mycothiol dehydrogenase